MAPRKTPPKPSTPREAAAYTQAIILELEKLAQSNSQTLLAHLLEMARREANWLSRK